MKIIYRIYNNWKRGQIKLLANFGINVETGFDRFDIENNDIYLRLEPYLKEWKVNIYYGTIYEDSEIDAASLLVHYGTWANGYPQPEDDFGYIGVTYKSEDYCKECGIGLFQQSPFRLKKEPNWGAKKMFELNWIFDELFVRKEVYDEVFKKFGVLSQEVLFYKKDIVIENTVQLVIPVTNIPLDLANYPHEICGICGRIKYSPQVKGYFPTLEKKVNDLNIFKSLEYFGSGASANKKIFITQELRQEMIRIKIKSQFMPMSPLYEKI